VRDITPFLSYLILVFVISSAIKKKSKGESRPGNPEKDQGQAQAHRG